MKKQLEMIKKYRRTEALRPRIGWREMFVGCDD